MSRRLLVAVCALIYFFLMLPLLVVNCISTSAARPSGGEGATGTTAAIVWSPQSE